MVRRSSACLAWTPWWCLALWPVVGCETAETAASDPGEVVAVTIGPAGGDVEGPRGAWLHVPEGAVAQEMTVAIEEAMGGFPEPSGLELRTPVFAFLPHGMTFTGPVTVRLPLPDPTAPEIYTMVTASDGGRWLHVRTAIATGTHLEVEVSHFSYFAVASRTSLVVDPSCPIRAETSYCGSLGAPCCDGEPQCALDLRCVPVTCSPTCTLATCFEPECESECREKGQLGSHCTSGEDCVSGLCVDETCCDSACEGQCEACDVPGHPGTCSPVLGAPRGDRPPCSGAPWHPETNPCAIRCDGLDREACSPSPYGALCGSECTGSGPRPTSGMMSVCDGEGGCEPAYPFGCAPFLCDGATGTCATSCVDDADCAEGAMCTGTAPSRCVFFTPWNECVDTNTVYRYWSRPGEFTDEACPPYRCSEHHGGCQSRCTSTGNCAPSHTCDARGFCVVPSG